MLIISSLMIACLTGLKPKKDKGPEGKQQLLDPEEVPSSNATAVMMMPTRRSSDDIRTQCSNAGHAVIARFDAFVLEPPRDHNLKILW